MEAAFRINSAEFDQRLYERIKNLLPVDGVIEIIIRNREPEVKPRYRASRKRLLAVLDQTPQPPVDLSEDEQLALVDAEREAIYRERRHAHRD